MPQKEHMLKAILLAKESVQNGGYAIGAVVVKNDEIISTGISRVKVDNDPTAHAEMIAIREACKILGSKSLEGCTLYVTHEPCSMCTSAAILAKMTGIVFGTFAQDAEQIEGKNPLGADIDIACRYVIEKAVRKIDLTEGFQRDECMSLLFPL